MPPHRSHTARQKEPAHNPLPGMILLVVSGCPQKGIYMEKTSVPSPQQAPSSTPPPPVSLYAEPPPFIFMNQSLLLAAHRSSFARLHTPQDSTFQTWLHHRPHSTFHHRSSRNPSCPSTDQDITSKPGEVHRRRFAGSSQAGSSNQLHTVIARR